MLIKVVASEELVPTATPQLKLLQKVIQAGCTVHLGVSSCSAFQCKWLNGNDARR